MVKKSGFLDKIVNRFRSGSVRVESAPGRRESNGGPRADQLVKPVEEPAKESAKGIVPESRRKLSPGEDAALAMNKSFGELSSLLRGVQVRMEDQGGRLDQMGDNLSKLPATADAQLEVLRALVTQLEKQNSMNGKMVETFAELPAVMQGVRKSLEATAVTDERTAQTLDEFKHTMDRIQHSMGDMVDASRTHADAAVTLAEDHKGTVEQLEVSTQKGLDSLRRTQEDQANRMFKLVSETGRWNRGVVVLLILSFAALVSIFVALVAGP